MAIKTEELSTKVPGPIASVYGFARDVAIDFIQDNGSIIAAAIAFYFFVSLVPMLLLAVSGLSYVLESPDRAHKIVFDFLRENAPTLALDQGEGVRKLIEDVVRGRGTIGGVGLAGIIWAGSSAFANLHRAVNLAWDTPNDRGFIKTRLMALVLLLAVGLLLLVSMGLTTLLSIFRSLNWSVLGITPDRVPFLWTSLGYGASFIVTLLLFTFMYKVTPTRPVPLAAALLGGTVAAVLWELARFAFSYYIGNFSSYSAVYGSLAGLIALVFWIYYSANILILGAEVGASYGKLTHTGPQRRERN